MTSAKLSTIYKQAAVGTWGKVGMPDLSKMGDGTADALSVDIPDKMTEIPAADVDAGDSYAVQQVKVIAATSAALIYFLGDLYLNNAFVVVNDAVKFSTSATIEGTEYAYDFILSPKIDVLNSKIYFESYLVMPAALSAAGVSSTQYTYAEISYDFDSKTVNAFRLC